MPYIEAATVYSACNGRIIFRYLVPRILPILIPSYVFLEATRGIFNVTSDYLTWGWIIHEALEHGVFYGPSYWVFEPIGQLLVMGWRLRCLASPWIASSIPGSSRNKTQGGISPGEYPFWKKGRTSEGQIEANNLAIPCATC